MSDLSQLLDDLYDAAGAQATQEPAVAAPPAEAPATAPAWASEEALDDVFASWVPGPSADATAAERSFVAEVAAAPSVEAPLDQEWLQATEPLAPVVDEVDEAPVGELVTVGAAASTGTAIRRWSPSDDDLLPARAGRRRSRR